MTLNALKEAIAQSPNHEFYNSVKIAFKFPQVKYENTFQGVVPLYEFILRQIEGFEKYDQLPGELEGVKKSFIDAKATVLRLITNQDLNQNSWINNFSFLTNNSPAVFLYDSPETDFLYRVKKEKPSYYQPCYEFITGYINNINNKNYLIGYLMAYEFLSKEDSEIVERKETEKKSIAKIRNAFEKQLADSESQLANYLANANTKYEEYAKKIDLMHDEKENEFYLWYDKTVNKFESFNSDSNKKMQDFEELYKEKLKLEAPAKYWNDRAKKLRIEGYWWLVGLILSIAAGAGVLIWVLNEIADGTFEKVFKDTGTAVKWSVGLITLISFLAYAIRVLSKLTFSSFHLVRDAEEREQLTYVYLALQKEKGVDQTERHLIMQSLFSRADSGLLKDDASPTMPGNIVDQITRK